MTQITTRQVEVHVTRDKTELVLTTPGSATIRIDLAWGQVAIFTVDDEHTSAAVKIVDSESET